MDKHNTHKPFSFQPGWEQIRMCDHKQARIDIMQALNISAIISFQQRKRGDIEPKVREAQAIESVLKKYGVKSNIWGHEITNRNSH